MNEKVYVTYENSLRANVSGVYTSRTLAEKERKERGDLDYIDSFELKNNNFNDLEQIAQKITNCFLGG